MKIKYHFLFIICALMATYSIGQNKTSQDFEEKAWKDSSIPIRPGKPGEIPFWNKYAKRFIYAPSFDFKEVQNASKYIYEISSSNNTESFKFESEIPYADLGKVWSKLPVDNYKMVVKAYSETGKFLRKAGERNFYRASPYKQRLKESDISYQSSARKALSNLMEEDYVIYWIDNKEPDPSYLNYRFPAKIYSALVIGALSYSKLKPKKEDSLRAINLAEIVGDYMLKIRFPSGSAWEYFVPTYSTKYMYNTEKRPQMDPVNNFTTMGVDAGYAFLELYEVTKKKKYLDAAVNIADTYIKNQMDNGSWYQFTNSVTNNPVAPNIAIPTAIINYFDFLSNKYKVEGLKSAKENAFNYIFENPVITFDWQGQFEDVYARPPYKNLSREQACELAIYLFNNYSKDENKIYLAEELIRFSEDQFVIWDKPMPRKNVADDSGKNPKNWISPSVQEQYVFWEPVSRSAGIMIQTFKKAYEVTEKPIYLEKAKSIANSFLVVQEAHDGDYPTFFTPVKRSLWLNNTVYPAQVMMNFGNYIENNL